MGKRVDQLLNGYLPGSWLLDIDPRCLIDEAIEAALLDAADHFMQRDGSGYVVEELLKMAREVPVPQDGEA